MTTQFLLIKLHSPAMPEDEKTVMLDALVAWGDKHLLFMGGRPPIMVVYAPLKSVAAAQRRSLMRLLDGKLGLVGFQVEMTEPRHLQSTRHRSACIESVSQAQRFLAERMGESADRLAGLAYAEGAGTEPDG